jgi:hypothetical protein
VRTAALRLPVAPADITSREDRFNCEPYRSTVTADCCVRRRALVRADIRTLDFLNCVEGCAIGKVVERNSGGPIKISKRITEGANHTGRHFKMMQAAQFGQVFEGDEERAVARKAEKLAVHRAKQREYQRARWLKKKAAKAAAEKEAKS